MKKPTLTSISNDIDNLVIVVKDGFKRVDKRLDKVESQLDNVDGRLDVLDTKMDTVQEKLTNLETGQEDIKLRLDHHAYDFDVKHLKRRVQKIEHTLKINPAK